MVTPRYGFSASFERLVTLYACADLDFYARLGHALEPDLLAAAPARLALQAAQAVAFDAGKPPAGAIIVIQRVRRWVQDGRVPMADLLAMGDYLDEADQLREDAGVTPDAVLAEALAPVRRRLEQKATEQALSSFGKGGDFDSVVDLLGKARGLGEAHAVGLGVDLAGAFGAIHSVRAVDYLETGIGVLDAELGGGVPRGTQTVVVGGPGDGKSMFMTHMAAHAARDGLNVAIATLELPVAVQMSRLLANLTGVPESEIRAGRTQTASQVLQKVLPTLGRVRCEHFTAHATTVSDVLAWLANVERIQGAPVDLFVLDYADKLQATGKDANEYTAMRRVYEDLRIWAEREQKWMVTASQAKARTKDNKKRRDVEDAADSMHKARVCDLMLTLTVTGEDPVREVSVFVAKNRLGRSRFAVGPLPTDFPMGRMVV
jgi:hypothetical protein